MGLYKGGRGSYMWEAYIRDVNCATYLENVYLGRGKGGRGCLYAGAVLTIFYGKLIRIE